MQPRDAVGYSMLPTIPCVIYGALFCPRSHFRTGRCLFTIARRYLHSPTGYAARWLALAAAIDVDDPADAMTNSSHHLLYVTSALHTVTVSCASAPSLFQAIVAHLQSGHVPVRRLSATLYFTHSIPTFKIFTSTSTHSPLSHSSVTQLLPPLLLRLRSLLIQPYEPYAVVHILHSPHMQPHPCVSPR
jgi:hypothetical protein